MRGPEEEVRVRVQGPVRRPRPEGALVAGTVAKQQCSLQLAALYQFLGENRMSRCGIADGYIFRIKSLLYDRKIT